jgi:predicted nucleic acid-binding protein
MYLLDTDVISELRKAPKGRANPRVVAWARSVATAHLYLSVITVQEIEIGILRMERRDPAQGKELREWFDEKLLPTFRERILPVDQEIARRSASLHVPDPRPVRDALIAATALVRGFTVVTRNVKDLDPMGVAWVDPWAE